MTDPYASSDPIGDLRAMMGMVAAAREPRAQAKVTGITDGPLPPPDARVGGIPVYLRRLVPLGTSFAIAGEGRLQSVIASPFGRHGEPAAWKPAPGWTRHHLGVREGALAVRRRARRPRGRVYFTGRFPTTKEDHA